MSLSPDSPFPILIYLAGPMDGIGRKEARVWRQNLGESGVGEFVCFYSPAHAYFGIGPNTIVVADFVNRMVLDVCNGVLAYFEEGAGFGTIREIDHARKTSTPVVIVDPLDRFDGSLMTYDCAVERDLDSGLMKLLEKISDARNVEPTLWGFPLTQYRPVDPEDDNG